MVKIDMADDTLRAVGEKKVWDVEHEVVARGLVEDFLSDGDAFLLAFYDDERADLCVIDYDVAAARHAVEGDGSFHLDEFERVAEVVVEVVDDVLAHPLLGREGHIAASNDVEDL